MAETVQTDASQQRDIRRIIGDEIFTEVEWKHFEPRSCVKTRTIWHGAGESGSNARSDQ